MEDYPRTLLELEDRFSTEKACRAYLCQLRWPEGFRCPRCENSNGWPSRRGLIVCSSCRHQASVTAGTIFQDTRKPLRMWFRAIWHVTSHKNGASAVSLQQALGLGSYLTAWTWLHKLRRAMVRPGRERLQGRVEVDETYIRGEKAREGRHPEGKALVAIAAEEDGRGMGRIRLACLPSASKTNLQGFIGRMIEPGATVHTDGFGGYQDLESLGYKHETSILLGKDKKAATRCLPRVHRVASLLKRWLLGTHQGAVSREHLDYYLDEFTFRFNRRQSKSRGKLFYRLLQQAVQIDPAPLHGIIGGHHNHSNHSP